MSYAVTTGQGAGHPPAPEAAVRLAALVAGYSVEVLPAELARLSTGGSALPRGSRVYVPFLPRARHEDTEAACHRLKALGYRPVPHVAARTFASRSTLDTHLGRLSDAGAEALLLIAGDRASAAGPYDSTLPLLDSGLLVRRGFSTVAVAGHPEGHPAADDDALFRALHEKAAYAAETGSEMWIVTQFSFSAEMLLEWLARLREARVPLPVHIGVPGPARLRTLLRYAAQCGVGPSARMLAARPDVLTHLLGRWVPDGLLAAVVAGDDAGSSVRGVHAFAFGGFESSVTHFNALASAGARGDEA